MSTYLPKSKSFAPAEQDLAVKLLTREALIMPKNVARTNGHFKQAVGFLKMYTNMTLPDAMKLADFSAQKHGRGKKTTIN